jgi:hypothetical protein
MIRFDIWAIELYSLEGIRDYSRHHLESQSRAVESWPLAPKA